MQDHVYFGLSYWVQGETTSSLGNAPFAAEASRQFQEHASDMLTNPSNDVLSWEKFPEPVRNSMLLTSPDFEFLKVQDTERGAAHNPKPVNDWAHADQYIDYIQIMSDCNWRDISKIMSMTWRKVKQTAFC